jgi:hypothetical protein
MRMGQDEQRLDRCLPRLLPMPEADQFKVMIQEDSDR